jgi:cytochrome c-type biogenesis protein CcmH
VRAAAVALLLLLAFASPAAAVTAEEIEREVMCTTCGVPLQVAESPAADAQRRQIRRLVDQGLSKREVEDRLIAIYGDGVLAQPRDSDLSFWAYVIPGVLVLLGAVGVGFAATRWRRNRPARAEDDAEPVALNDPDAQRVQDDIDRYER